LKYLIRARIEVDGKVDRHDVIGAIFGQTEGLLGSEFDLEGLQEKDKIGRLQVELKYQDNKTVGVIQVPSNLDRVETAIIAAMLETVDRVGPYTARVIVEDIRDLRAEKIKIIIERAKEILRKIRESEPDVKEVIRQVEGEVAKAPRLIEYGPERLPAGPDVETSDTIILVEGRADVINLLKYGYTNVIALEGAREKIPETIRNLASKKKVVLFVDGDRGGELIALNVIGQIKVDYVARAPKDREVEQLTGREIAKALSEMIPAEEFMKELKAREKPPEVREVNHL
jgi:DNA primase